MRVRLADARERHRERHRPSGFGFAVADSIHYLEAARWDAVGAGQSLFLQTRYLAALERARPDNLEPRYALIYRGRRPVAAVVMQIVTVAGTRLLKPPAPAAGGSARARRGPGAALARRGRGDVPRAPHRFGYRPVESDPNMGLEIQPEWRTYDDYLGSLHRLRPRAGRRQHGLSRAAALGDRRRDRAALPPRVVRPHRARAEGRPGARPERLWLWARHRNPALNVVIRRLLRAVPHGEAPDRNPFETAPREP